MTTIATGLTSDMLSKRYCFDAILLYIREGENRDEIIKKFKGDLNKTIQFLRERSYEGMEIVDRKTKPSVKTKVEKTKPKEEPNILDPMYEPKPGDYTTEPKKKKSPKPKATPGTQADLF